MAAPVNPLLNSVCREPDPAPLGLQPALLLPPARHGTDGSPSASAAQPGPTLPVSSYDHVDLQAPGTTDVFLSEPQPLPSFAPPSSSTCSSPTASAQTILFTTPPASPQDDNFPPAHSTSVLPPSFENMASNGGEIYHPVLHHWFYSSELQGWKPFTFNDSFKLEEAFMQGSLEPVATEGGRHDVYIQERIRKAVYWEEKEPPPVRRCSWFRKSALDQHPQPYTEDLAALLEEEYHVCVTSGQWHRQVTLPDGDKVMIHSPRAIIHYVGIGLEGEFPTAVSVNGSQAPLTVRRGTEDFEIEDGECELVDHLLFLVHGIGSVCDLRFRAVEQCVDDFRKLGQNLLATHFKQSKDMGKIGRVEILPVSWHKLIFSPDGNRQNAGIQQRKALHGDATGIDEKLKPITLRSIPKLREFTNDTILDVLLFNSPIYCQHIMDTVASEINRLYVLYCQRNPDFSGPVSLGGHSLGSVILFDLLSHQKADAEESSANSASSTKDDHSFCDKNRANSMTSPVDYLMGASGTGQPSVVYPRLSFKPEAFFLMGSPIAMFVTVRGIDTIGPDFELPTCKRVFNIFHPFDPVAYRLETLIDPTLTNVRPVLIPHHKGRKRMHLELKETIERVGSEFKQKIVDSIQGTWNRLYQIYSGTSSQSSIDQQVDEALAAQLYLGEEEGTPSTGSSELAITVGHLNSGRRIDYVLQEKPYESFNEYIFALQAHVTYWESEDTMLLILKELYGPQGVLADAEKIQPLASAHHVPDGSSPLSSPSTSPLNQHKAVSSIPASPASEPSQPIPMFTTNDAVPLLSPPQTSEAESSSHTPPPPFSNFQPPPPSTSPFTPSQSPLLPHPPAPSSQSPLSSTQPNISALQPPPPTSQSPMPPPQPPLLPPQPSLTPPQPSSSPLLPTTPPSGPPPSRGQPRVIGGRPIMELSAQTMGMDPTVRPSDTNPIGPPPKLPGVNFRRPSPFKR
ncbi:phospholipase DDHD2-like isoform X1 [Eriocheir sinensis]|uniref:phospholipase DDHD2-like isoform X1 n=1 Tax=Eriocheir sinensis TaxID=95602 RepID=UPI0021CADC21|nr:phospholipase DDHD2-like isoform X1 [Eriocheir sinensis]